MPSILLLKSQAIYNHHGNPRLSGPWIWHPRLRIMLFTFALQLRCIYIATMLMTFTWKLYFHHSEVCLQLHYITVTLHYNCILITITIIIITFFLYRPYLLTAWEYHESSSRLWSCIKTRNRSWSPASSTAGPKLSLIQSRILSFVIPRLFHL